MNRKRALKSEFSISNGAATTKMQQNTEQKTQN